MLGTLYRIVHLNGKKRSVAVGTPFFAVEFYRKCRAYG
ncbi:hypothetical protein HMPREF1153_2011 [Selenomonas sp. CM52]|nr:hypothetical protein HMPREF1153_2011 [Selenomonas sp. CM52]